MAVEVRYKLGQLLSRRVTGPSLLGDGLLERARSTSFALLGLVAAVGLAMIALVLHQGLPIPAGGPLPDIGGEREAIGDASVAAQARNRSGYTVRGGASGRQGSKASTPPQNRTAGGTPAGSRSPRSEGLVVSRATPVGPSEEGSPGGSPPSSGPVSQIPPSPPAAAPSPSPEVPSPTPPPQTGPSPSPQPVLASDDSGEHAHGRGGGHAYGHSKGTHGVGAIPTTPPPSPAPSPQAAKPPAAVTSDSPEGDAESHAPSWSNGNGHAFGRG
jgi:hypothetical protein